MEQKSLEKMVQRLLDIHEIQNVMSRHEYYHSAGMHREELEEIWAQKTPRVTFAQNRGVWEGMDLIKKCYVDGNDLQRKKNLEAMSKLYPDVEKVKENEGVGTLIMHTLTTPVIEVAGDGQTAKGVWMSPGQVTEIVDGKPKAFWMWERYGVDFVKEDGKWKIWHFHVYTDIMTPFETSWVDNAANALGDKPFLEPPEGLPKPSKDIVTYKEYSPKTVPQYEPRPPVPYATFSETFSY